MTPKKIKNATLVSLQQAVVKMTSPEWELYLEKNPEKRSDAEKTLGETQRVRLELENAQLAKIGKALTANEKDLTAGKSNLDNALTDLKNVQNVIDNAAAFIKIVIRILEIAGRIAVA